MNLNLGTLLGAIIGGTIGFFVSDNNAQQKTYFIGSGAMFGAIGGTMILAGIRKSKTEDNEQE